MSTTTSIIPFILGKSEEGYFKLGEEETVGYAIYTAEKTRKKRGFLRRTGERIEALSFLMYPLYVKPVSLNTAVVIDSLNMPRTEISYNLINREIVDKIINNLSTADEKAFIEVLVRLEKLTENIERGKEGILEKVVPLHGVVSDEQFVKDLATYLMYTTEYSLPFVEVPWRVIDHKELSIRVKNILDEIKNVENYVSEVVIKIESLINNWKALIDKSTAEKIEKLDHEITVMRATVQKNLFELEKKKESERSALEARYKPVFESFEKRIAETRKEIEKVDDEIRRAKEYGKDVTELKTRLKQLKKTLEDLERQLNDERNNFRKEYDAIEKKYLELAEAENAKVRKLQSDKEMLKKEKEILYDEAMTRFDKIRLYLSEYLNKLSLVKRKIESICIPTPMGGEGIYAVPLVLAIYRSRKKERSFTCPPVFIEVKSGKCSVKQVDSFNRYYSRIGDFIQEETIKTLIESCNLLKTMSLERLEVTLMRLSKVGLITSDKAKETFISIAAQLQ